MSDYHTARALEEAETAARCSVDAARKAHLELSQLHLSLAGVDHADGTMTLTAFG